MPSVTTRTYAEHLVWLVNEERAAFPDFAKCRSWTDLHEVCDANEFLILADEKFGIETIGDNEGIAFANAAIAIAEKILWPDFKVKDEGTIVLLWPISPAGVEWANEKLPDDATTFVKAFVIDHRYAPDILEGIQADGLTVEET